MPTGHEIEMYRNIARLAHALERIDQKLGQLLAERVPLGAGDLVDALRQAALSKPDPPEYDADTKEALGLRQSKTERENYEEEQ